MPRRETMRAQPRQPPAESTETSKVEHDEQTAHRQVKFIASKFVYGSKPGGKMTSQLLTQTSLIIIPVFIYVRDTHDIPVPVQHYFGSVHMCTFWSAV